MGIKYFALYGLQAVAPKHTERALTAALENEVDGVYIAVRPCATGEMILTDSMTMDNKFIRYLPVGEIELLGGVTLPRALEIIGANTPVVISVDDEYSRSFNRVISDLEKHANKTNSSTINMHMITSKNFHALKLCSDSVLKDTAMKGMTPKFAATYGHVPSNFLHDLDEMKFISAVWFPVGLLTDKILSEAAFKNVSVYAMQSEHSEGEANYAKAIGVTGVAGPAVHLLRSIAQQHGLERV